MLLLGCTNFAIFGQIAMVNQECNHRIELENFAWNGEIVTHDIILIKGFLWPIHNNDDSNSELIATLNQRSATPTKLFVSKLSARGEFKLLLDLNVNEDDSPKHFLLKLNYCDHDSALEFQYVVRENFYALQPLFIKCATTTNETPIEQLKKCTDIIDLNLRLVQSVYEYKLRESGFPKRTFAINSKCQVFESQVTIAEARSLDEYELWRRFATEILKSGKWATNIKFIAFIGCTSYDGAAVVSSGDYSYRNIRKHLKAHAALGAGGLALFGSAYFYAWPSEFHQILDRFNDNTPVDYLQQADESNYRRTLGGVYASTLGAICHELGHCFDLGHTAKGVMGHGFDYINRVLLVKQSTDVLTDRVLEKELVNVSLAHTTNVHPNCTRVNLAANRTNRFLDKYHEQRENDGFYFTRNCAIILDSHKWLQNGLRAATTNATSTTTIELIVGTGTGTIVANERLKLIEIRNKEGGAVLHYIEFANNDSNGEPVYKYELPINLVEPIVSQRTHEALVICGNNEMSHLSL